MKTIIYQNTCQPSSNPLDIEHGEHRGCDKAVNLLTSSVRLRRKPSQSGTVFFLILSSLVTLQSIRSIWFLESHNIQLCHLGHQHANATLGG